MRRLEIVLDWGQDRVPVGTLVEEGRRIYFEYAPAFLIDPLPISPFKLPAGPGLFVDKDLTFAGLYGVFNDSLPDGWGLLLMDRHFRKEGLDPARLTPLDRLAYIGRRAMGALIYQPPSEPDGHHPDGIDLGTLAQQAQRILEGSPEELLPALRIAGGSPGGARPKVLVGMRPSDGNLLAGTADLPEGYRHYLVKFSTKGDGADIGAVEASYACMAREAGIDVPATRIFETPDGGRHFGVERFDRDGNRRFHIHTLGGLLHASHRLPSMDYEGFLRATMLLTKSHRQLEEAFRRMAFNIVAHNRDDHVKNVSFKMTPDGSWRLAPAYDLVFSHGFNGWHSMSVAGEAESPVEADMLRVADTTQLEPGRAKELIEQVRNAVDRWEQLAHDHGVSKSRIREIGTALRKRSS